MGDSDEVALQAQPYACLVSASMEHALSPHSLTAVDSQRYPSIVSSSPSSSKRTSSGFVGCPISLATAMTSQSTPPAMATSEDPEKQHQKPNDESAASPGHGQPALVARGDPDQIRVGAIRENSAVLRYLVGVESRVDRLASFEAMGVERVLEDKRHPPQKLNVSG